MGPPGVGFPRVRGGRYFADVCAGVMVARGFPRVRGVSISVSYPAYIRRGFPRVRGGRRMARTAPGAEARALSAVCKSPAMCNNDLQKTAFRGSKAASSGGCFFARAARGAVPVGDGKEEVKNRRGICF